MLPQIVSFHYLSNSSLIPSLGTACYRERRARRSLGSNDLSLVFIESKRCVCWLQLLFWLVEVYRSYKHYCQTSELPRWTDFRQPRSNHSRRCLCGTSSCTSQHFVCRHSQQFCRNQAHKSDMPSWIFRSHPVSIDHSRWSSVSFRDQSSVPLVWLWPAVSVFGEFTLFSLWLRFGGSASHYVGLIYLNLFFWWPRF